MFLLLQPLLFLFPWQAQLTCFRLNFHWARPLLSPRKVPNMDPSRTFHSSFFSASDRQKHHFIRGLGVSLGHPLTSYRPRPSQGAISQSPCCFSVLPYSSLLLSACGYHRRHLWHMPRQHLRQLPTFRKMQKTDGAGPIASRRQV